MKKFLALVLTLVFTLSFAAIAEEKTAVTTYEAVLVGQQGDRVHPDPRRRVLLL